MLLRRISAPPNAAVISAPPRRTYQRALHRATAVQPSTPSRIVLTMSAVQIAVSSSNTRVAPTVRIAIGATLANSIPEACTAEDRTLERTVHTLLFAARRASAP